MTYIQQITDALDKEMENVAFLAHFSQAKLEKKLSLVKRQAVIAEKNKQIQPLELLKIWEKQISDALLLKKELLVDDNSELDMQLQLPEIEAYEMIERRQELMKQKMLKEQLTDLERKQNLF